MGRIRAFPVLLGFLLCLPVTYAIANQPISSLFSLMVPPVSALLIVIAINAPLRKLLPRFSLGQTDLIVIFAIVSVAGAIAGEWVDVTVDGTYNIPLYARNTPVYKDQFQEYIPSWLAITDLEKVQDIEGGGKDIGYVIGKLPIFLPVFFGASIVTLSLCFGMICINSLMRGAWNERERLTFPLIQLPVAMAEDGGTGGMWRSRVMWISFAIMFGIDMLNGFNYLYPNIPAIPVKDLFYIDRAFKEPPLSNIGDFRISIYPFMAAIGLFMPSDLLFSFVAFFLMRKATHVALAANGIPQSTFSGTAAVPGPPFFDEQTWGAVIAMFLGAVWVSREYLKEVWRDIRSNTRSSDGGVKHRWAFIGLIASVLVMIGFGVYGGLPLYYMVPYVLLFLVFSIVLTRIRAQLGPPTHEFAFFGPNSIMHRFLGTTWMTDKQATWVIFGFLSMNRLFRNHPMPYQLEAMKMGQLERANQKRIFQLIVLATFVGFFLAMFFSVVRVYRTGGIQWSDAAGYLQTLLGARKGPDVVGITMTLFGFATVMILDAIRFKFPGFPLHPAGYVLSMNYGVDYYWFGLLIALFVKNFVQRYYGLRGYDQLRMVALGILLGEYAAETIWLGMALVTHQSTYTISFNDRSLGFQ
jgi:ABC-type multidrug transport system fused ATPase/permease subunit